MKMTFAVLALTLASSFAQAASPEAILILAIRFASGEINKTFVESNVGTVGSLTTEGFMGTLIRDSSGAIKNGSGISSVSVVIAVSGKADSYCSNDDQPTSLVVTLKK